jgi:hypothetical protein
VFLLIAIVAMLQIASARIIEENRITDDDWYVSYE